LIYKLNILFILPEFYPHSGAGISTYYLHYLNAVKNSTNNIKVIVGSGYIQANENYNYNGITVEYLKPRIYDLYFQKFQKYELFPEYRSNIASAWAMWEQSNEGAGFDIIECTDFGLGFIPWLINHTKPVITRLHGSAGQIDLHEPKLKQGLEGDLNRYTESILLNFSDRIITHSQSNLNYWQQILPNKKIYFLKPVFIADENMPSNINKENYGIVCGRIQEWKGPDVLCEALSQLEDDVIIKWCGRDTKFDNKNSKSSDLRKNYPNIWGRKIIELGSIENSRIAEFQKNASYAIIPSIWDVYNFTGLEYMNFGTILICSDGAGISELIVNGFNGYKFAKNNTHELANCIKMVLSLDKQTVNAIIENAYQTLKAELCADKLIGLNLLHYNGVMDSFSSQQSNNYTKAIYEPSDDIVSIDIILNKQPLKKLLHYLLKRIKNKYI